MGSVKPFQGYSPPIFGKCRCGSETFKLKMNQGNQDTVECLVCAECGDWETVIFDPGFDINCGFFFDDDNDV
jgi:hypothetical protein